MNNIKKYFDIKLLFLSALSAFIGAFIVVNLIVPCGLYPAGYSGLTRIITELVKSVFKYSLNYSLIYFSLNAITCLFCFKLIGKKFTIYSIFQFSFESLFILLLKPIVPITNLLLFTIFGGILNGVCCGICLHNNFSTGGSDFISVFISHKYNKSAWNYIFAVNVIILCLAGILYGIEISMYSIVFQFFTTFMIKQMHDRYTYKTLTIITKKPDEVCQNVINHIRHSITEIKSVGYYSHTNQTMLYTVCNSFQYQEIIKLVTDVDKNAFINVQDTKEIHGNFYQKPLD